MDLRIRNVRAHERLARLHGQASTASAVLCRVEENRPKGNPWQPTASSKSQGEAHAAHRRRAVHRNAIAKAVGAHRPGSTEMKLDGAIAVVTGARAIGRGLP
jgi:hypothetical protein